MCCGIFPCLLVHPVLDNLIGFHKKCNFMLLWYITMLSLKSLNKLYKGNPVYVVVVYYHGVIKVSQTL